MKYTRFNRFELRLQPNLYDISGYNKHLATIYK